MKVIPETHHAHYIRYLLFYGGNDSPYVPKSQLFWGRFGSRCVEAAYNTNDMMLIFFIKVVLNFRFLLLVII